MCFIILDCRKLYDIYFVIDGLDSISDRDFYLLQKFIFSFVDDLNIGEGNGCMGMFVYSSFIVIMVELLIDKDYLKGYVMLLLYF